MNGADAFDLFAELSGQRVRRVIGWTFLLGVLFFRHEALAVFNWYVTERAHSLVHEFQHALPSLPTHW